MQLNYKSYTKYALLILLLIPNLFWGVYVNPDWGDDNFQYLSQAKNIYKLNFNQNTGYLFKEYAVGLGPKSYPPGYPIILSILYVFGEDKIFFSALILNSFLLILSGFVIFNIVKKK
jgi:hypothetical protein